MTGPQEALSWLPPPPAEFAARRRALADLQTGHGDALRALATHALDENQLALLAKTLGTLRTKGTDLAPLTPFHLGIISNATTHHLVPALIGTALRHGIALTCTEAAYGQIMQAALAPEAAFGGARPDAVLLALDWRAFPLRESPGDAAQAAATLKTCSALLDGIRAGLSGSGFTRCILCTLARPPEALFGSLDPALPGTLSNLIGALNQAIATSIPATPDLLFDVAGLAETVGLAAWHDAMAWNLGKLPFATDYLPLYVERLARVLAASLGKSRRCLILDLDNTLWGGVIGDDGLEGIVIGQGDPTGEAHLNLQRAALALRARGIVLAVSSKNDDSNARLPFRSHPEMALREEHFAVFQANWNDKATNITAIARELSLGLDAMVFVDDNPAERELVRQNLPQVAVPELPADPAYYARTLLAAGYFEAVTLSHEDLQRAEFYQTNARRVALQQGVADIEGYLASLDMVITFKPFTAIDRPRITQLINKSNQFNLTTRRYTEQEVAKVEKDKSCFTLQVRLADVFGDNGMISVIICRPGAGGAWDIDTWLMSCRVLGRRVETAVLAEILRVAQAHGVTTLRGRYLPTARNDLVRHHYRDLGFVLAQEAPDGSTEWTLDVSAPAPAWPPMRVERP
jgi:FkbH-like protein